MAQPQGVAATWLCADGRRLLLSEMEVPHIRNAIARIRRLKMSWRPRALPALIAELERRGLKDRPGLRPATLSDRFRNLDLGTGNDNKKVT